MYQTQLPFVNLLDALMANAEACAAKDIISKWLTTAGDQRKWLDGLRQSFQATEDAPEVPTPEDASRLYALSRCLDWLICEMTVKESAATIADDYIQLVTGLGLDTETPNTFHPFICEIHRVDQTPDADFAPVLQTVHWPAVFLGPLMIQRAGTTVRSGANQIQKTCAETGTLYWAWMRNRPREDLSDGWGRNSQWATDLRMDFRTSTELIYNLHRSDRQDRPRDKSLASFTDSQIRSIVRHRCQVTPGPETTHIWHWDETVREVRLA